MLQTDEERGIIECVQRISLSSEHANQLHKFLVAFSDFFNEYLSRGCNFYYGCLPEDSLWMMCKHSDRNERAVFPHDQEHVFSPLMQFGEQGDYPRYKRRRVQLRSLAKKGFTFTSLEDMFHRDIITSILECGDPPLEHDGDVRSYVTQVFLDAYQSRGAQIPSFLFHSPHLPSTAFADYVDVNTLQAAYV